jgi:hypothetical protein
MRIRNLLSVRKVKKSRRWNLYLYSPSVWCRSNQQAQADLQLLRQEINDFVRSVLANPENRGKSLAARSAAHLF